VKYAAEMSSGAMIYIASFIQTGSGIQKFIEGYTQLDSIKVHEERKLNINIEKGNQCTKY
jgi:hypothetical protein